MFEKFNPIFIKLIVMLIVITVCSIIIFTSIGEHNRDDQNTKTQHFQGLDPTKKNSFIKVFTFVFMYYIGIGHGGIYPISDYAHFIVFIICIFRYILITDLLADIINAIYSGANRTHEALKLIRRYIPSFDKFMEKSYNIPINNNSLGSPPTIM